jgi:flagellar biosynthesis chaperone FliJ
MSSSQEAAQAVRALERQLEEATEKVRAVIQEIGQLQKQRHALCARIDAKILDYGIASHRVGQIQATIAAMRSPLGYGGAPAESYEQMRARERLGFRPGML